MDKFKRFGVSILSLGLVLSPWWSFNGDTSGSARTYYGS